MTKAPKARLATAWLDGCSGCHMSLLDVDELLLTLADRVTIVFGPLVDAQHFPESVDVALIEGAVSSQDDLRLAQTVRENSKFVIALGDCAVTSNVPSMRNSIAPTRLLERVYIAGADTQPGVPLENVPKLLRAAIPLHEVIKVDLHVPGCPPSAAAIAHVLVELLDGRKPDLSAVAKFG
ncbi:MAG: NADP oxidoreductase [Bryobacteraceae bacterium]|nr:NADP oxidoreductase [Solibacteraceae bacterium]MCL4843761.1 NADP oxidoreductase [Bryobacteraceae bacterium]MCO5350645.1 NADP oxidoreductase [Bryobacteraceae bacterium]